VHWQSSKFPKAHFFSTLNSQHHILLKMSDLGFLVGTQVSRKFQFLLGALALRA
jgi:hypothetical protein